eukprot:TRINITY_DN3589_c0_g1_i2.p1 TRINITY_DN3589_c0_g1~~TRINITY_DN3589_c0_g1_i2.p1  ORF type:complete len:500 (-),score=57.32 TRINITY_DN3589_c0_g1_i2:1029-2423(-)
MMYEPPSRSTQGNAIGTPNCAGGCCLWFNNGAFIGCPKATGTDKPEDCPHPAKPTIPWQDPRLGTIFADEKKYCLENPVECAEVWWKGFFKNVHERNPWRYPGSAPVENSCGLNGGGYVSGPHGTGGEAFFGYRQGWKGTEVPPLLKKTTWVAGSTVEVAWGLTANHGGGYQYRLCRVKEASNNNTEEATEECFQQLPLEFVGDKQWIQFGDGMDAKNRTEIPAVRVSEGVLPKGSTWTRNPIPACNDIPRLGGHNHKCSGPAFPPPVPGIYGFGPGACASGVEKCTLEEMKSRAMPYGVVDLVRVPKIPPGDYILSFRWDCEQLPQVWGNCADVRVVAPGTAKPTKPFSSWAGCEACCKETLGACANCTKCQNDKTGPCEYCWKPLKGFTFGAIPEYQCLGYEGPDGGPAVWKPGMPFDTKWSPGCPKCWATKDSCKPSDRETQAEEDFSIGSQIESDGTLHV